VTQNLTGARLGQYELQEIIGQGPIATIYRAYQPRTGRTVAVKVFPGELLREEEFWVQFKREASVIARLKHPHILPIYDIDRKGDFPHIVFRHLPTDSLADWLRTAPLPLAQAVHITEQVASALDHAHQHGVVHQAIRPSNILIDANEHAYLFDFEIPCIRDATVRLTGAAPAGSPAYMAPELGAGAPATPAADIYALGVVLFEMLAGRLPFEADTPIDMMIEHRVTPAPPIRSINPAISVKTSGVVARSLAKIPEDRFETAGSLATTLRQSMKRREARPSVPPRPHRRHEKRSWVLLVIGLIIVAAALAIGAVIGTMFLR
jgi:serine/threonine protein kinase